MLKLAILVLTKWKHLDLNHFPSLKHGLHITITTSPIIFEREVPMHQQNLLMQKSKLPDCKLRY